MANLVRGDIVYVYASNHGKVANEIIFEEIIMPHGSGPFTVMGVGPTQVSIRLGDRNKNIPHQWVTRTKFAR